MITVDFLIREFPDGRLMLLLGFREGKNFRAHRKGNTIYYTWCPHEDDLKTAGKIYEATNGFNSKFIKKEEERRDLKVQTQSCFICIHANAARTVKEAYELIKVGFEHVTWIDDTKISTNRQ